MLGGGGSQTALAAAVFQTKAAVFTIELLIIIIDLSVDVDL